MASTPDAVVSSGAVRDAPRSALGILRELGPGLIIAGSVVGSGELIATTAAGAEAGFTLLWVILLGCVIKVFVQLEIGRRAVLTGRTTLDLLSGLPGWKPGGLHWIAWAALLMFLGGIGQMGGVAGGVGQSFAMAVPVSDAGRAYNEHADAMIQAHLHESDPTAAASAEVRSERVDAWREGFHRDVLLWTFGIAVLTAALLYPGRYGLIERLVTVLVAAFTIGSILNLLLLQREPHWAVGWSDLWQGLRFSLPPAVDGVRPVVTALAAFGIIGMAAGEIIFYPYWCLEKGYGRHVGPDDGSAARAERARGWLRVMQWDAWCSMVVYTISTVAFYLLGAAVLGRAGLHPQGMDMVRTLAAMYEPVFGGAAVAVFLVGAVAVLFSTFFVNNASSALVWTDAVACVRGGLSPEVRKTLRRALCVGLPLMSFVMFWLIPRPRAWVVFAGMTQTLMLPLLGFAAVRFRFGLSFGKYRTSRAVDVLVCVSAVTLAMVGTWLLWRLVAGWFA